MSSQDVNFIPVEKVSLKHSDTGDTIAVIDGEAHVVAHIISVFPISNRNHFVSLRDEHGAEIGIIEQSHELDPDSRRVLRDELERSYFLPRILDIYGVDDHLNLYTFHVETDRGPRTFEVRNPRQNVRSVGGGRYLIKDVDGNRYDVRSLRNLGPKSQNMMSEFV